MTSNEKQCNDTRKPALVDGSGRSARRLQYGDRVKLPPKISPPKPDSDFRNDLETVLREAFPHGHERFTKLLIQIADLHSSKNHDYAFGGDPMGNFRRGAKLLSQYPGLDLSNPAVYALILAIKQLDAVLWQLSQGHEAKVEGLEPRLMDISVYALIAIVLADTMCGEEQARGSARKGATPPVISSEVRDATHERQRQVDDGVAGLSESRVADSAGAPGYRFGRGAAVGNTRTEAGPHRSVTTTCDCPD